jgi:hypothetical protein
MPKDAASRRRARMLALWQLVIISELGLCFPNTKTSNAMAFLNLQTTCLPARRAPVMAGMFLKCKEKFLFGAQGNQHLIGLYEKMKIALAAAARVLQSSRI